MNWNVFRCEWVFGAFLSSFGLLTLRNDEHYDILWSEPSPVLIRALPPDANASHSTLRQELLSSVHCDNPAVLVDTKWSNCPYTSSDAMKKVSEKAGKIPLIGNNHRKDLSCNLAGQKRVHLWNTSKCSLPFSPGKQDTTTQQCHFLLAKVLIRKSWVYCHMSYTIGIASTKIFLQMLLTEHNTSHSMKPNWQY